MKPNVCGFKRKPFAQIFAESSSLPAPELWWSCQPAPRFSPLYFSFLPMKRRDFPGNVRSGGCDSLPLVGRFLPVNTVTHRSAMLSISFSRISHRMCCARGKQLGKNPLSQLPWEKCKKSTEKNVRAAKRLKLQQKERQNIGAPYEAGAAFITGTGGFDRLFILVKRLGPCVLLELWPWTWPDPWTKTHKQFIKVKANTQVTHVFERCHMLKYFNMEKNQY